MRKGGVRPEPTLSFLLAILSLLRCKAAYQLGSKTTHEITGGSDLRELLQATADLDIDTASRDLALADMARHTEMFTREGTASYDRQCAHSKSGNVLKFRRYASQRTSMERWNGAGGGI